MLKLLDVACPRYHSIVSEVLERERLGKMLLHIVCGIDDGDVVFLIRIDSGGVELLFHQCRKIENETDGIRLKEHFVLPHVRKGNEIIHLIGEHLEVQRIKPQEKTFRGDVLAQFGLRFKEKGITIKTVEVGRVLLQQLLINEQMEDAAFVVFHPITVRYARRDNKHGTRRCGQVLILQIMPARPFDDDVEFIKVMLVHEKRELVVVVIGKFAPERKARIVQIE